MVQCSTAVKQMSLQMFFEYCQTDSVDYNRESVPHGRRRDGESATADDVRVRGTISLFALPERSERAGARGMSSELR